MTRGRSFNLWKNEKEARWELVERWEVTKLDNEFRPLFQELLLFRERHNLEAGGPIGW